MGTAAVRPGDSIPTRLMARGAKSSRISILKSWIKMCIRDRLEEILLEVEALIRSRGDYAEMDSRFHAQIAACSHNTVMSNLVPVITDGVRVFASAVRETEYDQTLASHRAIFEAIRDGKAVEAKQAMYFHLMYNQNRYANELNTD